MSLPRKPQSRAGMPPRRARVLLGATHKVGKTTLLGTWAPSTSLIVDTQNGTLLLEGEHYVSHVRDWPGFVGVVDDICKGGHPFHTIGLDLVNDLWAFCDLYCGRKIDGTRLPASALDDYGRSSAKAKSSFNATMGRLLAAPVGIWFLTHLREKTDKEGQLVVYTPDLDKSIYARISGAVDFVWLAETQANGKRVVHTQPTKHFEAGSRVALPSTLAMDAGEIARALDRALNPQDYDESGERRKAEPEAPVDVPATAEAEVAQVPPEEKDVQHAGGSDIPATLDEPLAQETKPEPIGEAKAAEILMRAKDAGVDRPALAKSVSYALGMTETPSLDDDAVALALLSGMSEAVGARVEKWITGKAEQATRATA